MSTNSTAPYSESSGGRRKGRKPKPTDPYSSTRTPQGSQQIVRRPPRKEPISPKDPASKKPRRGKRPNPQRAVTEAFRDRYKSLKKEIRKIKAANAPSYPRYRQKIQTVTRQPVARTIIGFTGSAPFYDATEYRETWYVADSRHRVSRCWDYLNPGPPYMKGLPFRKVDCSNPWFDVQGVCSMSRDYSSLLYQRLGGFVPLGFGSAELTSGNMAEVGNSGSTFNSEWIDSYPFGATAWNRFKPKTQGHAQAAVFLGESGDVVGQVRTTLSGILALARTVRSGTIRGALAGLSGLLSPRSVSNHYLNHQFGWKPFIKDLKDLFQIYQDSARMIRQLRRDNGREIHRRGSLRHTDEIDVFTDHQSDNAPLVWPPPVGQLIHFPYPDRPNKWGNTITYRRGSDDIWFEGCFTYYVPELDNRLANAQSSAEAKMNYLSNLIRISGGVISPDVVWNLCPWSWLTDWFSNVGDVISNITAMGSDRLVSKFAYIMRRRRLEIVNDSVVHCYINNNATSVNCRWVQLIETKDRNKANPWGFAGTWEELTPRQLGIIGALGITRQRYQ